MLRMCSLVIISLFFLSVPMAVAGPRAVAVEPVKDLGKLWKGDNAAHDFAIRNDGDEVLQLFDVRPACGCVVAQFDRMIQPGETGTIHTWMNTSSLMGPVSKGLTVITNDSFESDDHALNPGHGGNSAHRQAWVCPFQRRPG